MDNATLAEIIDRAALQCRTTQQLSFSNVYSLDDAYDIQKQSIALRKERGEKLVGLKMGFTSEAKMRQMGVSDLIWGRLTDQMMYAGEMSMSKFIHPRAEPEICFLVSRDVEVEISADQAPEYVDSICAAIEIIDSRYENFKFSLEDVVADNCSSAGVILGEWQKFHGQEINNLNINLKINGEVIEEGTTANILGNPWKSFAAATRLAQKFEEPIKKGHIIMAGSATAAKFIAKDSSITVDVDGFESAEIKVTE